MPIIVKDFEWSESNTKVDITLPQHGVKSSNIDVMCTQLYVKVNYAPYYFELHLSDKVDDNVTRVVIDNNTITLYLTKLLAGTWVEVSNPAAKDKQTRMELIAAAVKYNEEKVQKDTEQRKVVKAEQSRWALRRAMDNDSNEKTRIEDVKQAERDKVTEEINEWQSLDEDERHQKYLSSVKENTQPDTQTVEQISCNSEPGPTAPHSTAVDVQLEQDRDTTNTNIQQHRDTSNTRNIALDERALKYEKIKHNLANPLKPKGDEEKKGSLSGGKEGSPSESEKPLWEVNGVRQKRAVEVSFTPRYFPSAARESLVAQEQEWMEKNMKASTVVKPKDADTKEEERNPMWLKDKARAFYLSGNFPAAINAYSEAISISSSLPSLYINRASCYIVLNLFEDCVTDCTKALELLNPPVEGNRLSRVRALVKRGSAHCQLNHSQLALADYLLASKLDPENEALQADVEVLLSGEPARPSPGNPVTPATLQTADFPNTTVST